MPRRLSRKLMFERLERESYEQALERLGSPKAVCDEANYLLVLRGAPDVEWMLGTREGAKAHVAKEWGFDLITEYLSCAPILCAVVRDWKRWKVERRARLINTEEALVGLLRRKNGVEILVTEWFRFAKMKDADLAKKCTSATAYLMAVATGILPPASNEEEYEKITDRVRRRLNNEQSPRLTRAFEALWPQRVGPLTKFRAEKLGRDSQGFSGGKKSPANPSVSLTGKTSNIDTE